MSKPNLGKMENALRDFLDACGAPASARKDLEGTPARVAALYASEFLDGYGMNPQSLFEDAIEEPTVPSSVMLEAIRFHAMCPHHLLPYRGLAYVGYVPRRRLLGFGRVAALVAAFSHRLTLQERIANQVAESLVKFLPAAGAGCILVGEHLCLNLPFDRHDSARVTTSAFAGDFPTTLQAQLWCGSTNAHPEPHGARG